MRAYSHTHLGLLLARAKGASERSPRENLVSLEDEIRAEAGGLGRLHVLEVKQALNQLRGLLGNEQVAETPHRSGGWNHVAMD